MLRVCCSAKLWFGGFLFLVLSCNARAAVLSIGHRGNSLFAPENTVAAFDSALGKAELVELDGQVTSDGYIIVMHDGSVDRTTEGTGSVSSKTLAQIKQLDAGSWFAPEFAGEPVPTLEEAVTSILAGATPLIERKSGSATAYVDELRRIGAVTNVIVQSFDWTFLSAVHALEPQIPLGALGSGTFTSTHLSSIIGAGARMVAWEKSAVTPAMLAQVRSAGLQLFVWTVDGAEIKTFLDMGVDGIISNDPGMVQQLQQSSTNSPVNLGEGMLAHWKMDDGLKDLWSVLVADSRGNNNASLVRTDGLSHWVTAGLPKFAGCVYLDGASGSITVPPTPALDINTNGLTISAWLRLQQLPSQLATSYGAIFDSTTDCYVLYLDRNNKELRFKITDVTGNAARPGIPESALPTNEWIHVAATYSGQVGPASGQATIYLNGTPKDVHTGNDGTSPFGLTANVKAGQSAAMGREGPSGGNYFTGHVDDFAIWNRALSGAEVACIYQKGQLGMSLADLTRLPTSEIVFKSIRLLPGANELEIVCQNLGTWQVFRLLAASSFTGDFLPVPGVSPVALGGNMYRFTVPLNGVQAGWYRIEGQ